MQKKNIFLINLKNKFNIRVDHFRNMYNFIHQFHIVDQSPWPFFTALAALNSVVYLVYWFAYNICICFLPLVVFQILLTSTCWFVDIVSESIEHTPAIKLGLKIGMFLFIISEILFFFSFFWGYGYVSLSPAVEIGSSWPGVGLKDLSVGFSGIPFANTTTLVLSGVILTCSHLYQNTSILKFFKKLVPTFQDSTSAPVVKSKSQQSFTGKLVLSAKACFFILLFFTVILAIFFTSLQAHEYSESSFFISDGVFGSTFFMLTGFHGFHVIIGSLMLFVCLIRLFKGHLLYSDSVGLTSSIWYWHFVDIVWILLFVIVYGLGSLLKSGGFLIPELDSEWLLDYQSFLALSDENIDDSENSSKKIVNDQEKLYPLLLRCPRCQIDPTNPKGGYPCQSCGVNTVIILFSVSLFILITIAAYVPAGDNASAYQYYFQDSASFLMVDIMKLHNSISIFLIIILFFVLIMFIVSYKSSDGNLIKAKFFQSLTYKNLFKNLII